MLHLRVLRRCIGDGSRNIGWERWHSAILSQNGEPRLEVLPR